MSQTNRLPTFALLLSIASVGCTAGVSFEPDEHNDPFSLVSSGIDTKVEGASNWAMRPGLFTGGQPSAADIEFLAGQGVDVVINLRPDNEQPFNEQSVVENAGMTYYQIDVAGASGVSFARASELNDLLKQLSGESVLVHCASGNRVGALVALSLIQDYGYSVDEAIEVGKEWGLTGLESKVRMLAENP